MMDDFGPREIRGLGAHYSLLEEARVLINNDRAADSSFDLDFDTAYGFVYRLDEANRLPLVPSELPGREQGLSNLSGRDFFGLIEASDVVMQRGRPEARERAARFVAELHGVQPYLTEINTKLGIMSSVLGLDVEPGAKPISLQLVEQYLHPDGSVEEQQLAADALRQRMRTMS